MFSSGPNYSKLKTNLRLAVNRLKLLEKKKTELALKARKEIADYIQDGKVERARIRVEHIIREDYLVEAYELTEMFADLLLARFGLLQQMKEPDEGLKESISSLIWMAPRAQADVSELKIIADILISKYGKPYGLACHDNSVGTVSPKLMQKMNVQAPPKVLVEKYLVEIAKNYGVDYEPDRTVLEEDNNGEPLIDVMGENNLGANGGGGGPGAGGGVGGGGAGAYNSPGFVGYPYMPVPAAAPMQPPAYQPFQYPTVPSMEEKKSPFFNIPPEDKELNLKPTPMPRGGANPGGGMPQPPAAGNNLGGDDMGFTLPDLPDVPSFPDVPSNSNNEGNNGHGQDNHDIDFDDLTKRFEDLKKRK